MPFFGLTDYVMVLDKDFRAVPLPVGYGSQQIGLIRRPVSSPEDPRYWICVTFVDLVRHAIFSKAFYHPKSIYIQVHFSRCGYILTTYRIYSLRLRGQSSHCLYIPTSYNGNPGYEVIFWGLKYPQAKVRFCYLYYWFQTYSIVNAKVVCIGW